jgi:hypothetical protein
MFTCSEVEQEEVGIVVSLGVNWAEIVYELAFKTTASEVALNPAGN